MLWLLKRQGVADADRAGDAMEAAFREHPHWRASESEARAVRRALYSALDKAGVKDVPAMAEQILGRAAARAMIRPPERPAIELLEMTVPVALFRAEVAAWARRVGVSPPGGAAAADAPQVGELLEPGTADVLMWSCSAPTRATEPRSSSTSYCP